MCSWFSRTSCGGFWICSCIPPRSSAVTPVRRCSQDVVILKHFQEGVDLLGLADELEDHAVRRKIDDLGLVDAGDLPQLGAVADVGFHLQQQQLPLQTAFSSSSSKTCRVTSSRSVCKISWLRARFRRW